MYDRYGMKETKEMSMSRFDFVRQDKTVTLISAKVMASIEKCLKMA